MNSINKTGQGRGVPAVIPRRPFKLTTDRGSSVVSYMGGLASVLQKLKNIELNQKSLSALPLIAEHVKSMCTTDEAVNKAVDLIDTYGLESKNTAHIGAILCHCLQNLEVRKTKFKYVLMNKIQRDFQAWKANHNELSLFLSCITFVCEVFNHMRLPNGDCYECLIPIIGTYFNILLEGGSETEIEVVAEHFPKCAKEMKTVSPNEFNDLLLKLRKMIISESSSVVIRSSLLRAFELIISNREPLNQKAKAFYQVFTKSTANLCDEKTV